MDILYNIGISAYKGAVWLASVKNPKARKMLDGQAQTFDYLRERLESSGGYIWIHVASLGEFEQGRPLIELIRREHPEARILLTFFSPSGYEVRKNYDQVDAVCYLPFDLPGNVRQFLDLVKPSMAIFVKYEFWGNYLRELQRRSVPTFNISAIFRPGQVFFKPWGGKMRKMLHCFITLFVQNEESRQLLKGIDIDQVQVCGDTRFDRVAHVREQARQFPVIDKFVSNARMTAVMGSSWAPDEDLMIPYFNSHTGMKLILAPHEFDRERLLALMARMQRPCGLYSQTQPETASQLDCIIIDTFGMLSSLYRYGQLAMVGGGFGSGIHNINEAAVYGIPVLFGPNYGKFSEAKDLIACGGSFTVSNAEEFSSVMDRLLSDHEYLRRSGAIAEQYIQSHLGATQLVYNQIKHYIKD